MVDDDDDAGEGLPCSSRGEVTDGEMRQISHEINEFWLYLFPPPHPPTQPRRPPRTKVKGSCCFFCSEHFQAVSSVSAQQ